MELKDTNKEIVRLRKHFVTAKIRARYIKISKPTT